MTINVIEVLIYDLLSSLITLLNLSMIANIMKKSKLCLKCNYKIIEIDETEQYVLFYGHYCSFSFDLSLFFLEGEKKEKGTVIIIN